MIKGWLHTSVNLKVVEIRLCTVERLSSVWMVFITFLLAYINKLLLGERALQQCSWIWKALYLWRFLAEVNSTSGGRAAPRRGSDSRPIQTRLCVLPRPLPRRPALSPYFQPVWTQHPGLPAGLGGYTLVPAGVKCVTIWVKKREFCASASGVYFSATMNIFRLTGDLSHLAAIIILLLKIWKSRSCAGEHNPKGEFIWIYLGEIACVWRPVIRVLTGKLSQLCFLLTSKL